MNLWHTLTEKSWLAMPGAIEGMRARPNTELASKTLALYLFLAIATVFFALFGVTFVSHSQYPDFQALTGAPWKPLADTSSLWFNTGLLVLASLGMQGAVHCARRQKIKISLVALMFATFFSIQFLFAQLGLWQRLDAMGYGLTSNPASSYFYLFTALHGLHLFAGMLVLTRALVGFWQRGQASKLSGSIQLCTRYWHFLLLVWLAIFALLTASPKTYQTLAAICGF